MSAADRLDALARALGDAGWSTRPRYEHSPAQLHVFHPGLPTIEESVRAANGRSGLPVSMT